MGDIAKNSRTHRLVPPSWLGIIVLFLGALALVKLYLFQGRAGFEPLRFHPAWLLIIWIASRYGFWPAMASAVATTVFYSWSYGWTIGSRQEVFSFYLAAWLLGEIRDQFAREERSLRSALSSAEKKSEAASQDLAREMQLREALQSRIAGEISTFASLYESAKRLSSFDPEQIYRGAVEIMKENLKVDAGALYMRNVNDFTSVSTLTLNGTVERPAVPMILGSSDPLVALLLMRKSVVSIRDLMLDPQEQPTGALLALAPIKDEAGAILGFISVEKINFLRFSTVTLRLLELLGDWIGQSLRQARLMKQARSSGLYHPDFMILSHAAFPLIRQLLQTGSVAKIDVELSDEASTPVKKIMATLVASIEHVKESGDLIFEGPSPQELFWWTSQTSDILDRRLRVMKTAFDGFALTESRAETPVVVRWSLSEAGPVGGKS